MNEPLAVDTSVAVPLVQASHHLHADVVRWLRGRPVRLSGHAQAETYAVLTRLPHDAKLAPADAADLIAQRFLVILPHETTLMDLPLLLSRAGIFGGAVWDALVGLAARDADSTLATRDARALQTYRRLGVEVEIVS